MARPEGSNTRKVQRNARYRAWQSMRILRRFTVADLMATAEISRHNVEPFLRRLERFGYIRRVGQRRAGYQHPVLWMMVRNTGPNPPRCMRDGGIFDPNTGEVSYE